MWLYRAFCTEKVRDINDKLRAELATVTSQRNGARSAYAAANKELAAAQLDVQAQRRSSERNYQSMKDMYLRQLAERDELIADLSGRLADALERNALIDREEDMRDEVRAKRLSDGLGDD